MSSRLLPGSPPSPPPPAPLASSAPVQAAAAAQAGRRLRSAELFGPNQEIEIEHGPAVYRLRQTALGKLILTK